MDPNLELAENDQEIDKLMNEIGSRIRFVHLCAATLNHLPAATSTIALNSSLIFAIERNAFHRFLHVQKIDLSNNLISDLDAELFSVHERLEEIDLSRNDLRNINKDLLLRSAVLRELNFASNSIDRIEENGIFSFSLIELDLSRNKIETVHPEAFFYLPELKYLDLSDNLIERLDVTVIRLVGLKANNNRLEAFDLKSNRIESVFLHDNRIVWFDRFVLSNTESLVDLELTDSKSSGHGFLNISDECFKDFSSLETLKIKVTKHFDCHVLKYLTSIRSFQLTYTGTINLTKQPQVSLAEHFPFANNLTRLVLIVDAFYMNYLDRLFVLSNLRDIRVNCSKPIPVSTTVRIHQLFERNQLIETIKFAYLNRFFLPVEKNGQTTGFARLRKLTLIGLKCDYMDDYINQFRSLTALKLLDGKISWFKKSAFQNLEFLTKLYLEKLQLKKIGLILTKFLYKLEVLSLMDNQIFSIESYTFAHLDRLKLLNLKGNPLSKSLIDATTFHNLNKFGTRILVDDDSVLTL